MRHAAVRQVSKATTTPASVRGLNAYDSIVAMPPGFAIVLRNLYAQPYGCQVRRGFRRHVVGLNGPVETVASHNLGTDPKLYAFVQDDIEAVMFDVTTPNIAGVQKLAGLSNARWQHLNFSNPAGVNLVAVNGADPMIWVKPNSTIQQIASGDGSINTIAGVDPAALIHIEAHQKRLWFVEKGTLRGWYLPPEQLYGIASPFDFSSYASRGGDLVQIITWTVDGGDGSDDHLVAITSEGQALVYRGTDPDGADTWGLVGVYYCGAPIGQRPACRSAGDVMILTVGGVVYLSDLLKNDGVNPLEGKAKYIQQLISVAASAANDLFGWQPFIFPSANMVMVNIPATETTSFQFALNDITKAWSEFIGYQANCWELHKQLPFYGGFGAVYRAWEGTTDDAILVDGVVTEGEDIRFEAQTTFDYFQSLGRQKHYKMCRPTIMSRGKFALSVAVNVDFVFDTPLAPTSFTSNKPGKWDEDYWDQATWEGGLNTYKNWQSVVGIGTAGSLRILGRSGQETYWPSVDWLYEEGGVM